MTSVGDGFAWPFKDPAWPGKLLVQGLILIIPIIGWIAMTGWLMLLFENARSGKTELPPAGFHLERGIGMFGVFLIYALVIDLPAIVLFAIAAAVGGHDHSFYNPGTPLSSLASLLSTAGMLLFRFLTPALIVMTYHEGFAGGMDVVRVWRLATAKVATSIIAGLVILVAGFIGGLGFLCCIGFIFTIPYENVISAAAAAGFEKEQGAPAPLPPAA